MIKNSRSLVVVVKGVVLREGKILLVQRALDDPIGPGTWECAGGKIEFGEELEAALEREMREETGLEVTVGELLYASSMFYSSTRHVVFLTYLCSTGTTAVQLSNEHMDYRWCTKAEISRLLLPHIFGEFAQNGILELEGLL